MSDLDHWWSAFGSTLLRGADLAATKALITRAFTANIAQPLHSLLSPQNFAPATAQGAFAGSALAGSSTGAALGTGAPAGQVVYNSYHLHADNYVGSHDELLNALRSKLAVANRLTPGGALETAPTLSG